MELAYVFAFGTAILFGVSALFEDEAAKRTPLGGGGTRSVFRVTTRLPYLIGMALSLIGWMLSLLALQRLPLFSVQAVGASAIGVVVVLDWVRTREPIGWRDGGLLAVLAVGLVALAVSAQPDDPKPVSGWFDAAIWIAVAVLGVSWVALMRSTRTHRASALLATLSGLAYGGTALCARALETDHTVRGVLFDPLTIALVPFAVIGIGTFAAALQRGPVTIAAACQHAVMTIVPSAVGLVVLGDRARSGFAPLAAVGFAVTVGAVLALTLRGSKATGDVGLAGAPDSRREPA